MIERPRLTGTDVAALACCVAVTLTILFVVGRDVPWVGHDYRYYVPRLLDTRLHLEANGPFAIQWYTPTFGGGIPAFPNPQHLQHSVLQLFAWFVDPWTAILATIAVASVVGFYAFKRLLEDIAGVSAPASTLGAVVFLGNGFYIEHLIAGHVGYQLFPLAAVMAYAIADGARHPLRNACIVGLVIAALLYHAGVYLIVAISLSLLLLVPLLAFVNPGQVHLWRSATVAMTGVAIAAAIGAAKVHAVMAFMRHFPREIETVSSAGVLQGLVGIAAQLFAVMTMAPVLALSGFEVSRLGGLLGTLTEANIQFGIWELDVGLSPVVWVVCGVAAVRALNALSQPGGVQLARGQIVALVLVAAAVWLLIEATLGKGLVYPLLKPLPILRSLHVNPRLASAFIMPLALVTSVLVSRWFARTGNRPAMALLIVAAVASPLSYVLFSPETHQRTFDLTTSLDVDARIRAGERLPVAYIANVSDADALALGASSHRPYEPLFGYSSEFFVPSTWPGNVHEVRDGAFNMHHAAAFVFPEVNGVRPFQRIDASDTAALEALVNRGQPPWEVPVRQRVLNWISVGAFVAALAGALVPWRRRSRAAA